jgi:hypothetical protein
MSQIATCRSTEVAVEGFPQVAAGDSGPRPRARVRQNHLPELPRTAHIVQRRRRQIREIAFCEPLP